MNKAELAKKIEKEAESGHWIWHGRMARMVTKKGEHCYPVAFFDGRSRQVARIVWERNTHTTLTHTSALHRLCSEERCVNPDHYTKESITAPVVEHKAEVGHVWPPRKQKAIISYDKAIISER